MLLASLASGFMPVLVPGRAVRSARLEGHRLISSRSGDARFSGNSAASLKTELYDSIARLNKLKEDEGDFSVDFGVKGGELDSDSRAPRKLDFYTISENVGRAADKVFTAVDALSAVNPTPSATSQWGTPSSPLCGTWRLLFSTAADATFSKNSKRGAAQASNVVAEEGGRITNVIEFAPSEAGRRRLVESLRVRLGGAAAGANRIVLTFRYAVVQFGRFFRLPVRWRLYIPVPGPMLTRLLFFVMRRKEAPPLPYFDVLYLDGELRVHRTGEGNLFIQKKAT